MNNVNITIISNENGIENSLDSTRSFGIFLNKAISTIKMVHWYTENYNTHKILGELYDSLSELFDELQEEIIGTCKLQSKTFPQMANQINFEDIHSYVSCSGNDMKTYYEVCSAICSALTSQEFQLYSDSVMSGLNNTKEEILSSFNKTNYLLSLVKD
jgi:DNA-binding ferritin-like protein